MERFTAQTAGDAGKKVAESTDPVKPGLRRARARSAILIGSFVLAQIAHP